nr:hypothetical protein [Chryseolinea sp.]
MIIKMVLLGILAIIAFGFGTMWLWNWLVPTLFNGPIITFWQTLGLILLSKIFFSGFGGKSHNHHNGNGFGAQWKRRFVEKVSSLSPQEREAFKQKMKDKWCSWDERTSDKNSGVSND